MSGLVQDMNLHTGEKPFLYTYSGQGFRHATLVTVPEDHLADE